MALPFVPPPYLPQCETDRVGILVEIHDFASRGWRVLCPSQLGYGDSSHPVDVGAYSFKSVAYDMNSVLDACGVKGPVIVVGHDWCVPLFCEGGEN